MKLCIVFHSTLRLHQGKYLVKEVWGEYLDKISPLFEGISFCAPINHEKKYSFETYTIKSKNISITELFLIVGSRANYLKKLAWALRSSWRIYKTIKSSDIIWLFMPGYKGVFAAILCRILSIPYIAYLGIEWKDVSVKRGGIRNRMEHVVVKGARLILVAGKAIYNKYKVFNYPVFETIPAINLSKDDVFYREDTCLSEKVQCLFVGSLESRKGVDYLIQSMIQLVNMGHHHVSLKIVGTGRDADALKNLALQAGLNDKVAFLGYIPNGPQLLKVYKDSDIFILPSLSEGFPRVLYEAMSQSVPIIATGVGGIPELMKDGEHCLIISPKSSDEITQAILRIEGDKNSRKKYIANARSLVLAVLEKDAYSQVDGLLKQYFPEIFKEKE